MWNFFETNTPPKFCIFSKFYKNYIKFKKTLSEKLTKDLYIRELKEKAYLFIFNHLISIGAKVKVSTLTPFIYASVTFSS